MNIMNKNPFGGTYIVEDGKWVDKYSNRVIPIDDIKRRFTLSPTEYEQAEKIYKEKGTIEYTFYPCGGIGWGVKVRVLKTGEEIDITDVIKITRKLIKEREESVSMYEANSRKELADMYKEQIQYLKVILPPEISEDKIQEAVMTAYPNGYTQKEMGKVIKEIKAIYPTADGKMISEIVKEHIV